MIKRHINFKLTLVLLLFIFCISCGGESRVDKVSLPYSVKPADELYLRAETARRNQELKRAAVLYSAYLEQAPRGFYAPSSMHNLASIRASAEDYNEAIFLLKTLMSSFPQYPDIIQAHKLYITVLLKAGWTGDAEKQAALWLNRYPNAADRDEIAKIAGDKISDYKIPEKTQPDDSSKVQAYEPVFGSSGVVYVGCLLPLSGSYANYGEEILRGIQLSLQMFEKREDTPDIELIIRDTAGDPDKAVTVLDDLVFNRGVSIILGPLASRTAFPVANRAKELGITIVTFSQAENIVDIGDTIFRFYFSPDQEITSLVKIAYDHLNNMNFAIMFPDNAYGQKMRTIFKREVERKGGRLSASVSYATNITDFENPIKDLIEIGLKTPSSDEDKKQDSSASVSKKVSLQLDFDALFIPDTYKRIEMIAPQLVFHDINETQLLGSSLWDSPSLLLESGNYIQRALFPTYFFKESSVKATAFAEAYVYNFGLDPGQLAAAGFDSMGMLQELFSANNSVIARRDIARSLSTMPTYEGITGNIKFMDNGESYLEPLIITVKNKNFIIYKPNF